MSRNLQRGSIPPVRGGVAERNEHEARGHARHAPGFVDRKEQRERARAHARRGFLGIWTLSALAAAAAFVLHLAIRFEVIRLGYELGRQRSIQADLLEDKRLLSLEAASLRDAARVELVARGTLGMSLPTSDRIIPIRDARPARRAAGRTR
ncbi:MAG: cell division protein FtsL [Deltaproteobacteria bacterium]|nr:cell division protein FtsL [Deltaproteobacteria bacterium]